MRYLSIYTALEAIFLYEYYAGIGRQTLDNCDRGVAMVSGDQIKFLAAGREHSHIVNQDEQGRLCLEILHGMPTIPDVGWF